MSNNLKRAVRERMEKTGEKYTTALMHLKAARRSSQKDLGEIPDPPTDEQSARAWLQWLANSNFEYHIDDDPFDITNFTREQATQLKAGVDKCFELLEPLGQHTTWEAYGAGKTDNEENA